MKTLSTSLRTVEYGVSFLAGAIILAPAIFATKNSTV